MTLGRRRPLTIDELEAAYERVRPEPDSILVHPRMLQRIWHLFHCYSEPLPAGFGIRYYRAMIRPCGFVDRNELFFMRDGRTLCSAAVGIDLT